MKKIFVAVISRNMPYWPMISHFNLAAGYAAQHGIQVECYPHVGDSLVCRARNECAAIFLNRGDSDYLFTLDDDVVIPHDTFKLLVDADKDMIGGMYLLKKDDPDEMWLSGRSVDEIDIMDLATKPTEEQIVPFKYLSTGCVLHKKQFVQEMWDHYSGTDIEYDFMNDANPTNDPTKRVGFYQPYVYKREYLSEDWAFCQRALDKGYKLFGHAGVRCAHYGMKQYAFPKEK